MTAITTAIRLLREAATELKSAHTLAGDWGDEHEALDAYNEHIATASALERLDTPCLHQISEPAAVAGPVQWDYDAALEAALRLPQKSSIFHEMLEQIADDPTSGPVYRIRPQGRCLLDELQTAFFAKLSMTDEMRSFIEGMSVSVDVSTGDNDAYKRYFGTVTEVMDDMHDKHGVTLLVHDAKPNFAAAPALEAPAHQCFNSWFLSLPEGRQDVLRDDKWMLASAAYEAGRESLSALEAPAALSDAEIISAQELHYQAKLEAGQETVCTCPTHPPERAMPAVPTPELQRMTAGRATYFMERFLREEKLLGPNEQAALRFVINMLEAPAAPAGEVVYRWQALDFSGYCYGSNPPEDLPARCNLTPFYRQPDAYRAALHEISATGNLTATGQQFARHLKQIARDALAAAPHAPAQEAPDTPAQHQGMTIAGNGAAELGKLMREQRDSRMGVYPDGNPNSGQP